MLLACATFWAGTLVKDERSLPSQPTEPRPTAPLERRVLSDELRVTGTVVAPSGIPVTPLPPTLGPEEAALVTRLPVGVGVDVINGGLLAEIAGHPIVVLEGTVPMYRTLRAGAEGSDVAELQQALMHAGYSDFDPPGRFGPSTGAAAVELFKDRGYELPREKVARSSPTESPAREKAKRASARPAETVPIVPLWSIVFVAHLPAFVSNMKARVGQQLSGPLLTLAHGSPNLIVKLEASQLHLIRPGMRVRAGVGLHGEGVVTSVTTESKSGEQTGGKATVSWARRTRLPHLGSEVEVSIVRASSRRAVWCVPFSAIGSGPGATSYVEVEAGRGHFTRVEVSVGLTAGGYAAVTPRGRGVWHAGEPIATVG